MSSNFKKIPSPELFKNMPIFNLGFRIFFLAAGLFSVVTMSMWLAIYQFQIPLPLGDLSPFQWHAHEMLYGYGMAVIAGFLLTSVKNWTGEQTIYGAPLAGLFALWIAARILWLFGSSFLWLAAVFDIAFNLALTLAICLPIIKVKQWRQIPIMTKVMLLTLCHIFFYSAVLFPEQDNLFMHWGLYGALYLIVALILTMGRRVMPFFIERGVGYPLEQPLFNSKALDLSSLFFLLAFFISEMLLLSPAASAWMAFGVFVVNAVRLIGWHTYGIWEKSLLWGLYLAFWSIAIGFLLFSLSYFIGIDKFIAIHAMTVGAIGLITMAMMCRVSLGHTGRGVASPPVTVDFALGLLLITAIIRVFPPLLDPSHNAVWIGVAQIFWILAFLVFVVTYFPILSQPRVDGKQG